MIKDMIFKFLLIFVLANIMLIKILQSQTIWTKTFGGTRYDFAYSVHQTLDDGYIITGQTYSFITFSGDVWLIKTNSKGDTIWSKTYGGSNVETAHSVQQTIDSGYVFVGVTESFGAGDEDTWLVKTNSAGNTLWTKTYGGSDVDLAFSVRQTSDEGFIIAGITESFGAGMSDVWIIKTDKFGVTENYLPIHVSENYNNPINNNLYQNYPNPFNPSTKIAYYIAKSDFVILKIYNVLGQEIQTLVNKFERAGNHIVNINSNNLSSSIYFYTLQVGNDYLDTKKMILMR